MSLAQMFCALTTVALGEASLRGLDAGDAAALEHQALDLDAFDDLHAAAPRRAREAGRDEIGVGEARLGLEADQRRVVEAADRQALRRLLRARAAAPRCPAPAGHASAARSGASFGPSGAAIR